MKKAAAIAVLLSCNLFAIDASELSGLSEMQRFYYQLGKTDSKKEYFTDGYRQAMRDFADILKKYKERIHAYEAGKYLVSEGKITYPKVYRIKDESGSYRIQIDAPTVEKSLTEKDLFLIPLSSSMAAAESQMITEIESASDGFAIPERDDTTTGRDSAPEVIRKQTVVRLPYRNEGIKGAIDSYNIPYAVTKDGYDLMFSTTEEKIDFCMKATGNAECKL